MTDPPVLVLGAGLGGFGLGAGLGGFGLGAGRGGLGRGGVGLGGFGLGAGLGGFGLGGVGRGGAGLEGVAVEEAGLGGVVTGLVVVAIALPTPPTLTSTARTAIAEPFMALRKHCIIIGSSFPLPSLDP